MTRRSPAATGDRGRRRADGHGHARRPSDVVGGWLFATVWLAMTWSLPAITGPRRTPPADATEDLGDEAA
ncbi:hypothetical protein KUTG_00450 [Kutzneria sp. 744]|nr:hypothetical protein KUTG_00450 [Kutzneria sp. 744]